MSHSIPAIAVDDLLDRYDAFLFDAYGVLVHDDGPLPGAAELLARLDREGRRWLVVTNDSTKLPETTAARFQRFGLPIAPGHLLTSGMLLRAHFEAHGLRGRRCAVMGTPDSERYVAEAGGEVVPPDQRFDVLVIGGCLWGSPLLEVADAAVSSLFTAIDDGRPVHLVVPNPDLIYPRSGGFGFAAGTLANMFEGALALRYPHRPDLRFTRLGKPNTPIFEEAIRRVGATRAVMIGDQLETDIKGARAAGLDAVWIETGVTAAIPDDTPAHLRPTWRMSGFVDAPQEMRP